MKLFKVGKVGLFCDAITHATEKRDGDETKILVLTLRCQPFDAKLATAVADVVRQDLFKLNRPDPKPEIRRLEFALGVPRQILHVFASSDTPTASIAFDQVKISGTYARTEKDVNGYAFVFKASFGPCSKTELEYAEAWRLTQRFVSFEEAEPGLFSEGNGEDERDDDRPDQDEKSRRPAPMFDTDAQRHVTEVEGEPVEVSPELEAAEPARKKMHSHAAGRKARAQKGPKKS